MVICVKVFLDYLQIVPLVITLRALVTTFLDVNFLMFLQLFGV